MKVQRFDLGVGSRKEDKDRTGQDRTGQDRTVKTKSQSGNISPIWGKAPTVPIKAKICMADNVTYAKFQNDIFKGYDFTGGGVEFHIFLLIFAWTLQQRSATVLANCGQIIDAQSQITLTNYYIINTT